MIPFKPADDLLTMLVPVAVVLVLLLAAAAVALTLLKRRGTLFPASQARRLKLIERLPVSRRSALLLVEYDGRPLLLGESGDQLRVLEPGKNAE